MIKKEILVVLDSRGTFAEKLVSSITSFMMLCFCIWMSQGSEWWTFICGILFIVFVASKLTLILVNRQNRFETKEELIEWAKKQ